MALSPSPNPMIPDGVHAADFFYTTTTGQIIHKQDVRSSTGLPDALNAVSPQVALIRNLYPVDGDRFPPDLEPEERAQIRSLQWVKNYCYNVRSQMKIAGKMKSAGRRKLAHIVVERMRGGALPSVYTLATELRKDIAWLLE